jgi:hypothetical protein
MFKPKDKSPTTEETSRLISVLFSRFDAEKKTLLLNLIDHLPWLNSNFNNLDDHCYFLNLVRLAYAKLFNCSEIQFKKNIH